MCCFCGAVLYAVFQRCRWEILVEVLWGRFTPPSTKRTALICHIHTVTYNAKLVSISFNGDGYSPHIHYSSAGWWWSVDTNWIGDQVVLKTFAPSLYLFFCLFTDSNSILPNEPLSVIDGGADDIIRWAPRLEIKLNVFAMSQIPIWQPAWLCLRLQPSCVPLLHRVGL